MKKERNTSNIHTVAGIDWLQATFPHSHDTEGLVPFGSKKMGKPMYGYTACLEYDTGIKVYVNSERRDMGNHVVASGNALRETRRKFAIREITMLKDIVREGGRLSRLDLFLDVFDGKLEIDNLSKMYSEGNVETRARSGSVVKDLLGDGQTLYIGKRGSRKFLRVYNKAAELDKSGDWIRVEIELRKDAAVAAGKILSNAKRWQDFVPGIIKDFVNFPDSQIWQIVMNGVPVEIGVAPKDVSGTEKWLLEVCAPALGKLSANDRYNLFERFVSKALTEKRKAEDEENLIEYNITIKDLTD